MKNWFRKHSIAITLIPVVAVMVMIFCFSAQTGEESGAMSGNITRWIAGLLVQDFDTLPGAEQAAFLDSLGFIVRKLAHFSEYALLGFFLMLHIRQIRKRAAVPIPWLWAWGIGALYAASDELHQAFVGGRGPALMDVGIDSCGVIAGIMVCSLVYALRRKQGSYRKI